MINVTRTYLPPFEEFCDEIRDLWDSRIVTNMGPRHEAFREALEAFLGVPQVSLFSSGHLALEAILRCMKFPAGGEVITTPFTFVSTVNAIIRCGLVPVFADVNPSDGTLDPESVRARKYFYPLASDFPFCKSFRKDTPVARDLARRVLCLPLYPGLEEADVERICAILKIIL